MAVRKGQMTLRPGGVTVNPDIVLEVAGETVVGDIKYKLGRSEWKRADLYQVVAFAAAYRVPRCGLIGFSADGPCRYLRSESATSS